MNTPKTAQEFLRVDDDELFMDCELTWDTIIQWMEEYATLYASEKLKEIEGKWVSVDERLPNHEGLVLISNIHDKWLVSGWLELNSSAWYNQFENEYDDIPVYPTHWMEFPPLPSSPPL